MKRWPPARHRVVILFMLLIAPLSAFGSQPSSAETSDEQNRLALAAMSLLQQRCANCHGAEKQEGGWRFDSRAALESTVEGEAVIDSLDPAHSRLLTVVTSGEMPPKQPLSAAEIAVLQSWLASGPTWPDANALSSPEHAGSGPIGTAWDDGRNPIAQLFRGERLDLWSLRPVSPPVIGEAAWGAAVNEPLDVLIQARVAEAGLTPAPRADRRTIIRRLSFDLTGLPPSPGEVEQFLADTAPDAVERVVDRLLASPRYGEHQARQWLDVVRYSDSNGFDWDEYRPQAWRYRDYVVRSFNADKPYRDFVIEQLAGDELVVGAPKNEQELDRLVATGFLRLGPQDNAAELFNEQDRSRAEWLADLTETTGSAFLGLTLSCCRCHDHKFDPLSQADHFRIRAFFGAISYGDGLALDLDDQQRRIRDEQTVLQQRIDALQASADALRSAWPAEAEQSTQPLSAERVVAEHRLRQYDAELTQLHASMPKFQQGLLATDDASASGETHLLVQGDHRQPRELVAPGFLSVLEPAPAALAASPNPQTTGRRLTLARWIVADDNPLSRRVMVNRVWQGLFGRGLVATPNDFGLAGARPSHPDVLDHLAAGLLERGWSLKALQRRLLASATYQQRSSMDEHALTSATFQAVDANNSLYWRQNPRRLTAEQLRDALLLTSGLLDQRRGGSPAWPELPLEVLQANPAFLDDNSLMVKGWYTSSPEDQRVRSLYLVQKRNTRLPLMELFDLPENAVSCGCRTSSIVAPQALSLLNNAVATDAAKALAERIDAEAFASDDRIALLTRSTLQRGPSETELELCRSFLRTRSFAELCRAFFNLNEFIWLD